jgi:hypothetical protein
MNEVLAATEMAPRGLDGGVAEQELHLSEVAAGEAAENSPKVGSPAAIGHTPRPPIPRSPPFPNSISHPLNHIARPAI